MSYFSDLHITGQAEGHAGMHAQLVRDLVGAGRTATEAHAAADRILAAKRPLTAAELDASPVFELEPVARPVAQRLGLEPMRAGVLVRSVRDHLRPDITADCLAGLIGQPLEAVLVALEELDRAGTTCDCGKAKESGEFMCAACARLEELEAGRDYEEEERQIRLLKALPDGDYTASELQEYLS